MSDVAIGLSGLGVLFVLIMLRFPIAVALIGVSFVGLWLMRGWGVAWGSLGVIPYEFTASWVLSSIPMFLFLGFVSFHTELTKGLFHAARVWTASLPGGLAIASVFGSAGFAAVSGSSLACSAAMGRIAIPEMIKHKYHPELATGTVAVAGTIGAMIPPSIILILYGVIAQQSVAKLFLGGISAGIITAIGYVLVVLIRTRLNPSLAPVRDERLSFSDRLRALKDTWPILLVMIGIFGGLFGGIFTPTEAGAVGAFLACLIALVRGDLTLARLTLAARETLTATATLIVIAVGASLLTRFLVLSGAGDYLSETILALRASPAVLMLGIVIVYLILGMFLEPIGCMLLTLPIILPVVDQAGWSLLWFGVVLCKLLEIGMITPPIGMNVFVIKGVVGDLVKTGAIFRGVLWFLVMDLFVVLALSIWPQIILALPAWFG
ncbi:TRAP transporter large permease [Acidimangrovimonas sediminis]|uniref:TRAP transporter large permease n=1 Tax=Acidimangrovimonas sediminis TaxID=2056283 RepID=UPI000C8061D3|nr:TRAP transporter large permease [Acidimangrovimonas sediminis]